MSVMVVERVLDTRISDVTESGDVAEVSGQVATVFPDLHLSLQQKKYDKMLSANGFEVPAQVTTTSRIKLRGLRLSWMHSKSNETLPRIVKFHQQG